MTTFTGERLSVRCKWYTGSRCSPKDPFAWPRGTVKLVRWIPPLHTWIKLNMDETFLATTEAASGGGLIRDEHGETVQGFQWPLHAKFGMGAELFARTHGRTLAKNWETVFRLKWMQRVVNDVANGKHGPAAYRHVMVTIRNTLRHFNYKVTHINREGNRAADYLVNLGCTSAQLIAFDHLEAPPLVKAFARTTCFRFRQE